MALPVIPNAALGMIALYAYLAKNNPTGYTNAALYWVLLTGTIDSTVEGQIRDADTLAAIIALTVDEATFTGYSRLLVADADISLPDPDSSDSVKLDITTDPSWNPTTTQLVTGISLVFDPDTTTGTDSSVIPLFVDTINLTTGTGGAATPLTYQVAAGGLLVATQA